MTVHNSPSLSETSGRGPGFRYRPGDLVVSARGYPTLFEVISVCDDGLLRLRGVNWAAGYSVLVPPEGVRPTSGILHGE